MTYLHGTITYSYKIIWNSRYIEYAQYLTYDRKSLVADFGGYLGLLLGSSLLTFYDLFKRWTSVAISWIKNKMSKKPDVANKLIVRPSN